MYLLDSNAWITFLRRRNSPIIPPLRSSPVSDICICSVVVAELYYGCLRSARPGANRAKIDALIQPHRSLPFDDATAEHFARLRHHLESQGMMIGPYDLQIASIAIANGGTLVTHNTREFSRIPGLNLEDWEL